LPGRVPALRHPIALIVELSVILGHWQQRPGGFRHVVPLVGGYTRQLVLLIDAQV